MISLNAIIERFKSILGLTTDMSVAQWLGINQSAFAERKRKRSIPYEELIDFAINYGISIDWLLTGKGRSWQGEILEVSQSQIDFRGTPRENVLPLYPDWRIRLKSRITGDNSSVELVSQKAGIDFGRFNDILQGAITPTYDELVRLGGVLGVSERWLAAGYHDMNLTSPVSSAVKLQMLGDANDDHVYIPCVTGEFGPNGEQIADNAIPLWIAFKREWIRRKGDPLKMFLLRVAGDSMEPTLFAGDLILIDGSRHSIDPNGGIYSLVFEKDIMIRRVQVLNAEKRLKIICDNTAYEAVQADEDEVRVQGRVIWFSRMLER